MDTWGKSLSQGKDGILWAFKRCVSVGFGPPWTALQNHMCAQVGNIDVLGSIPGPCSRKWEPFVGKGSGNEGQGVGNTAILEPSTLCPSPAGKCFSP